METYCHKCDKFVNVSLKEEIVEIPFMRGIEKTISCLEYFVTCDECGEELYLPCVNDINVLLRECAIKREKEIINPTLNEIKSKLI